MRRIHVLGLIALCLCAAGVVVAGNGAQQVTNPGPALSASMQIIGTDGDCTTWQVSGKVKPSYRGFGSTVQLVCQNYNSIGFGGTTVFPQGECDGPCASFPDPCGNFTFNATICGDNPQLDNSHFCTFVVHVDTAHQPQACGKAPPTDTLPPDPNGSAPCSGGICPDAP
jgi:hypothetical protein